jgi:hypothetical protein
VIAGERQRVRVDLGDERSYDVVIGRGVVDELLAVDARTFIVLYDTARRRRQNVGAGRRNV